MKFSDVYNTKCEKLDKLIYLTGSDPFLIQTAEDYFLSCGQLQFKELNVSYYIDKEAPAEEIKRTVCMTPFGGEKRAVVINTSMIPQSDYDAYVDLLYQIPDFSSVILYNNNEKEPDSDALMSLIKKKALRLNCSLKNKAEISEYITDSFAASGMTISPADASYLYDYTQPDFAMLNNEIDKLKSACGKTVNKKDIEKYCIKAEEYRYYIIHNCLVNGDKKQAFSLLSGVVKDSLIAFISYLGTNFEMLHMIKSCTAAGYSSQKTFDAVFSAYNGKYDYRIKSLIRQQDHFTIGKIRENIKKISDADFASKHHNYFLDESIYGFICGLYETKKG